MKRARSLTLVIFLVIFIGVIGALVFLSRDNPPVAQPVTKTFPYEQTAK